MLLGRPGEEAMYGDLPEEGREGALGSIGVLGLFALATPSFGLSRFIITHLPVKALLVLLSHFLEPLLLLVTHSLPALSALLGELGEDDILVGVLLLVLLAARLHEESVGRHAAARLVGVGFGARHFPPMVCR